MIHIKDRISINADQARYILEQHTNKMGVFIDLDRALDYQAHYIEEFKRLITPLRLLVGDQYFNPDSPADVVKALVRRFGVSENQLMDNGKVGANKRILNRLAEMNNVSSDVKSFLTLYRDVKDASYRVSYLEQYINLPLLADEDYKGNRMVLARPRWEVLATSRISAAEPSIQNVAREFADMITYPKGYLLLFSDSGQIEPRVTYSAYIKDPVIKHLINLYNDAYFGQLHYVMMQEDELDLGYQNPEAILKQEWDKTLRKDLKTLGLAGNYGSTNLDAVNGQLANRYSQRIVNHPSRLELEERVKAAVYGGAETFYAAFGTPITPEESTKFTKGTPAWRNHLVRCGINNPIQGTASELMCESVYVASTILEKKARGYSAIGMYKHDEGMFYLAPQDHGLADELAECMAYQVEKDGELWIPIYADKHIGQKEGNTEIKVVG
jgi:DNA polymerase I-like protein with 3'-5' exonuclease and polymerase domains